MEQPKAESEITHRLQVVTCPKAHRQMGSKARTRTQSPLEPARAPPGHPALLRPRPRAAPSAGRSAALPHAGQGQERAAGRPLTPGHAAQQLLQRGHVHTAAHPAVRAGAAAPGGRTPGLERRAALWLHGARPVAHERPGHPQVRLPRPRHAARLLGQGAAREPGAARHGAGLLGGPPRPRLLQRQRRRAGALPLRRGRGRPALGAHRRLRHHRRGAAARERVRGHADARAPRPGPLQRLPAAQEPHAANFDNNELENNQVVAKLGHLALGRAPGPPRRTPTTRPPPSPRAPRLLLPASRRRCSGRPALPHDAGPRREPVVDPLPARPPTPYLVSPDARCGPGRASRGGGPPGLAARRWLSASRRATRARCGPPSCPPTPRRAARPKGVLGGGARRPVRAAATAPAITLRPGGDVLLGVKGARAPACFAWTPRRRSGLLLRPARGAAGQLRLLGTLQSSPATTSPSGSLSGSQDDSDSDMAFSVNQSSSASESSLVTAPSSPLSPPVSPVFPPPELAGSKNGECTVCFDGEVDTVIYTCGHMCLCYSCGLRLKRQARACCPICRRPIKDVIKIYRP
nr:E3 ubiquitin-protein ligase NEURL1B [Camelus dromedarius]